MLRPFLIVSALVAGVVPFTSCKKVSSDDGGTRSDGQKGLADPTSNESYTRAFKLVEAGMSVATPMAYNSPLTLAFDAAGGPSACLLTRLRDNSPVFRMSLKCLFDDKVVAASIRYQQEEKPGQPAVLKTLPIGDSKGESLCGGPNAFAPFDVKASAEKVKTFSAHIQEILNAGGQSFVNPMTGALYILNKDGKYLVPGLEACSDRKSGFDGTAPASPPPEKDKVFAANWRGAMEHDPMSPDMFGNAKREFFSKHFLGYVGGRNKTVDDPFIRKPEETFDDAKRSVDELLSREMHAAVPARGGFFPIVYPVKGSDTSCVGYGVELVKVRTGENTGFVTVKGGLVENESKKTFTVDDWNVTVVMQSTPNQKRFAHSLFAVGVFSDQVEADVVLAMSPAVRMLGDPLALTNLYDCSTDGDPTCEVMRGPEQPNQGTCPRLTLLLPPSGTTVLGSP